MLLLLILALLLLLLQLYAITITTTTAATVTIGLGYPSVSTDRHIPPSLSFIMSCYCDPVLRNAKSLLLPLPCLDARSLRAEPYLRTPLLFNEHYLILSPPCDQVLPFLSCLRAIMCSLVYALLARSSCLRKCLGAGENLVFLCLLLARFYVVLEGLRYRRWSSTTGVWSSVDYSELLSGRRSVRLIGSSASRVSFAWLISNWSDGSAQPIISYRNSLHLVSYLFIFCATCFFLEGKTEFQATFAFKLNNKKETRDLVSRERVNRSETNPHSCRAGRSTEGQREDSRVCWAQRVKVPREFLSARSAVIKK